MSAITAPLDLAGMIARLHEVLQEHASAPTAQQLR